MSNGHGITEENLMLTFPAALREDASLTALGKAMARVLAARPAEISGLSIYARIDELPEELLDILAYDFKVDWWDADASLEQKRRTLKDSWNVHRRLGTPWAVRTALGNAFPGAVVEEWFEYGGNPYCFRVTLPVPDEGVTAEQQRRALSRVWYYKNLRSHLDAVELKAETSGTLRVGAYTEVRAKLEIWPKLTTGLEGAGILNIAALAGATQRAQVWPKLTTGLEGSADVGIVASSQAEQSVGVWPKLAKRLDASGSTGIAAGTRTAQPVEAWPHLNASAEANARLRTAAAPASRQTIEAFPLKK